MKRIFLALMVSAGVALGQNYDVSFSWKSNAPLQMVTKYVIYQAKAPSTNFIPVFTSVSNTAKIRVTGSGTYDFKILAVNGVGESPLTLPVRIPNIAATTPEEFKVLSIEVK